MTIVIALALGPLDGRGAEPIKIGVVLGITGALEVYAKQMVEGFKLGLEYGTQGKTEIGGTTASAAALEKLGGKVVHEGYMPMQASDFTAPIQRIIGARRDRPGQKYVFVI